MKWLISSLIILFLAIPGQADEITELIPAIVAAESSGNPLAISKDGCRGLTQLSKAAWDEVMTEPYLPNVYNPELNKVVGERYLRLIKRRLGKDYTLERMLAAYNCGLARLKKYNYEWWRMGETRRYVRKVTKQFKKGE